MDHSEARRPRVRPNARDAPADFSHLPVIALCISGISAINKPAPKGGGREGEDGKEEGNGEWAV